MKGMRMIIFQCAIGLTPAVAGLILYRDLPVQMATHIGIDNQVDGYMDRPAALAMLAFIGVIVPVIASFSRKTDPTRANFASFSKALGIFRWAATLFLTLAGHHLIAYNLGYTFSPKWLASLGIGFLFLILGNYMGQIRYNYTVGIRTPWTLANPEIWRRTHRMAGPFMMIGGLIAIASLLVPEPAGYYIFLAGPSTAAGIPMAYSYWLYRTCDK